MSLARTLAIASTLTLTVAGAAACSAASSGGGIADDEPNGGSTNNQGNSNGSTANNGASSSNGGSASGNGGASSSENDGGGADAGASAGSTELKGGTITVSQTYIAAAKVYSTIALADFYDTTIPSTGTGTTTSKCTTYTESECTVTVCPPVSATDAGTVTEPTADAGIVTPPNAGAIAVSGPQLKTALSLTVGTSGTYGVDTGTTEVFAGGDSLAFKAVGATVPAFDTTLVAPAVLNVTAPTATAGTYSFARTTDLVVKFTGGDAATTANVMLSSASATSGTAIAQCSAPSAGGTVTLTAAALGHFPANASGSLSVGTSSTKAEAAGSYTVNLTVTSNAGSGAFKATN